MSRYKLSDGMVVDTDKAAEHWDEETRFDGSNQISRATGSQWDHETLYCTRRGRYYLERSSQRQGSTPGAEWLSNEEAVRWLTKTEHELPDDLRESSESVDGDLDVPRNPIYRVVARRTGSVQPTGTFWDREVLYCGDDRQEARRVYHESEPEDFGGGYGNQARETISEVISDADSDDFADDEIE